jgi:hypothetical protein
MAITDLDATDLLIDGALFEERVILFGCPEEEIDYEYVAALIRLAYCRGVRDCYAKAGGPDDLRATFGAMGFEV